VKVAFRADASDRIGSGHIMRCLTLADELCKRGHTCLFICRHHPGHLGQLIEARGYPVYWLQSPSDAYSVQHQGEPLAHAHWLGASWEADADQTRFFLENAGCDWLIVDHYGLDYQWEQRLSSVVPRMMVIDDLADRYHCCQLLLDQNALDVRDGAGYTELVNPGCQLMLGPFFALLGCEYALLSSLIPERRGRVARVLVFVGGSDPFQLTETYLDALSTTHLSHLSVDVVLGKNYPFPERIHQKAAKRGRTEVYSGLPSLAGLMIRADVMLGGGGATNWERFCLGLPALVTSIADNQDAVNQMLAERGLIYFQGKVEQVSGDNIARMLLKILENPDALTRVSSSMRAIVDGKGTSRVADKLEDVMENDRCRLSD